MSEPVLHPPPHAPAFTPATDVLGHTAPLSQRTVFPLLGVPVEIASNSPAVIAAAERSFGGWRTLEPERIVPGPPLSVRVIVHPGGPEEEASGRFTYRSHGPWFVAGSGANLLTARVDLGETLGVVTPALVDDDPTFRRDVLEFLALALVSRRDRTPIHAGAVVRNGLAIVLTGRSRAGKSTLCYACVREGFQLLTEEAVYVSTRSRPRLWGNPATIHLLPDARRFFPELAELPIELQPNGKRKLALDVSSLGPDRLCRHADRALVCLLQRTDADASRLEPIDRGAAIESLACNLEPGFDLFAPDEAAALLAEGGAYRLTVGREPAGAVRLLKQLTD